jgi:predicted dehydrogenase
MRELKVGVVGCGSIARRMHLPAWANMPNVEISALCDCDEKCLRQMSEQFGVRRAFADFEDMLLCDDLDVIDICTPNFLHMPQAVAALEAGKHVMVEKPLARNFQEAVKIVKAARKNDRKLTVAFPLRFRFEGATLKKYIDAGELGDIYYVHARALRRRGVPSRGVFTDKKKQGGGPLIDLGVHYIDLMLWLMGHPKPVSATGTVYTKLANREGSPHLEDYTVEDLASGFVRFDNGASMVIETSFAANVEKDTLGATILGDQGGATFPPLTIYKEECGALVDLTPIPPPPANSHEPIARSLIDSIRNGGTPAVTGEEALIVMKIVDAIYMSAETGREEPVEV